MNTHGESTKCDCYSCSSELLWQDIRPGKGLVELRRLPSGRFEVSGYCLEYDHEFQYTTSELNAAKEKFDAEVRYVENS